tara:strand:- start:1518 stop:1907 length:390 start_codon:yes stop_codon:yes gene_type:complete
MRAKIMKNTLQFQDVDTFELEYEHFSDLKQELGYETVWSIEGIMPLDKAIFTDTPRVVKYKCIKEMGDTFDDVTYETFTAVAENGTLGALWKAAESCYQQAKLAVGDWHYFIENFQVEADGTLTLETGS